MSHNSEYQEELQKIQDRDFTHSWVASSGFLFYLQLVCMIAFMVGVSYMLTTKRYSQPKVKIQESTLYTPQYK